MTGPSAASRAPARRSWSLAALLAALVMLGPFSIDMYLPAFPAIGADFAVPPVAMQATLSAYLFAYAFMMLWHGALSDALGRRPVVLAGLVVYAIATLGCAIAGNITTAWSWFGVNELGIGLHAYGFTEGVLFALGMFVVVQAALIVGGLLLRGQKVSAAV